MRSLLHPLTKWSIILTVVLVLVASNTKTPARSNVATATRRSQNAARTIQTITTLPEGETIPVELLQKSLAIGVFPDVIKMNVLFQEGMKGYGVICSRQGNSWSLPAFYSFGSSQLSMNFGFKSFDLIVLFVSEDTMKWFQSGRIVLEGLKAGFAGPVGKMTREKENSVRAAGIVMYALVDNKLKGLPVEADLFDGAVINPDNNINNSIYGVKGREILNGVAPKSSVKLEGLTSFSEILKEKLAGQTPVKAIVN
jgi:lipid-binding SYLF domain-containing protein